MTQQNDLARALELVREGTEILRAASNPSEKEFAEWAKTYQSLFEALKEKSYYEREADRGLDWLEESFVPQSMQFMIDCLPVIHDLLFENFQRGETLSFLDVGAGSGSAANLIATLHCSPIIWSTLRVEAIDFNGSRKRYASLAYPKVELEVGDIRNIPEGKKWDFVYCSHTLEHVPDPSAFLAELVRITGKFTIIYAPYDEVELIRGHRNRINEATFAAYNPILMEKKSSFGWHRSRGDLCILAVIDAAAANSNLTASTHAARPRIRMS